MTQPFVYLGMKERNEDEADSEEAPLSLHAMFPHDGRTEIFDLLDFFMLDADYQAAYQDWRRLTDLMTIASKEARTTKANLDAAKSEARRKHATDLTATTVKERETELADKVASDDTVQTWEGMLLEVQARKTDLEAELEKALKAMSVTANRIGWRQRTLSFLASIRVPQVKGRRKKDDELSL